MAARPGLEPLFDSGLLLRSQGRWVVSVGSQEATSQARPGTEPHTAGVPVPGAVIPCCLACRCIVTDTSEHPETGNSQLFCKQLSCTVLK